MRTFKTVFMLLMLSFLWPGCHKDEKPQIRVEEISPDRHKMAGRLIKEKAVNLELGKEILFMPVRSDSSVYLYYNLVRNEVLLQSYDHDLSRTASHSFKEGQGPGEWQAAPEFVGYDDNLLMIDRSANRITWYDENMNIVSTLRHKIYAIGFVYSEVVKREDGTFGFYYYLPSPVGNKQGYYLGNDIQIMGGTIGPQGVDCDVYYETFKGVKKTKATVFEEGEKILFSQAGDSLYIVDAETYTLTRMSLSGVPIRSVQVKTERPEFSKETLQKWAKGFYNLMGDEHKSQWNPIFLYPSPIWPVAGMMPLGKGLAVITCENYDPENKPEMLRADFFDLDLNFIGEIYLPTYPYWNCPSRDNMVRARGFLRWQMEHLFLLIPSTRSTQSCPAGDL